MQISPTFVFLFSLPLIAVPIYHYSSLFLKSDTIPSQTIGTEQLNGTASEADSGSVITSKVSAEAPTQPDTKEQALREEAYEWLREGVNSGTQLIFTKVLL